jgi:hypothetical protein
MGYFDKVRPQNDSAKSLEAEIRLFLWVKCPTIFARIQCSRGEKILDTQIRNDNVSKRTVEVIAIAMLIMIFASSIFVFGSRAYFPGPPKNDPPAVITSVGPDVRYAIGSHRIVCMGCWGPQPNITLPERNTSSSEG